MFLSYTKDNLESRFADESALSAIGVQQDDGEIRWGVVESLAQSISICSIKWSEFGFVEANTLQVRQHYYHDVSLGDIATSIPGKATHFAVMLPLPACQKTAALPNGVHMYYIITSEWKELARSND